MHTLLRRQLRRLLDEECLADPRVAAFVAAVDQAYRQSDTDRAMLERALDLSSDELLQANAQLRRDQVDLEARVTARTAELEAAHRSLAAALEERLRAQEALTREEAKFRIFLEQLPAITYVAQPGIEGRWLFVSPRVEPLLGFTVEQWLADPGLFYARLHPDDRAHVLEESERSRREHDQMSSEYRLIARDGRVVWFRDDAVFLPADGAEPERFQGVMLDVTERRALQDQLLHAQKVEAVGQLAGGVAHDFNNLLTAITGYAELLQRKLGPDHPAGGDVRAILLAAERATRVTGRLLAFSRRSQLDPRNLDVGGLLLELEALLQRVIGERIVLRLDLAAEPLVVRVDPTQLEQVIVNLVVNARDAMPGGGMVAIRTRRREVVGGGRLAIPGLRPGTYLELAVADDGTGMSEEVRRRLFEPFFTTKPVGQGTGLGLATAYGAVQQSGGTILVETELGRGTTFRVLLPVTSERGGAAPAREGRPGALATGTERILFVEDEPDVRAFGVELLASLGYAVVPAADGAAALERFQQDGPAGFDLLVTDVVMPRMGGVALARALHRERPELPILFASGYSGDDDIALLLGPRCQVLRKPFSAAALARALRELLGQPTARP